MIDINKLNEEEPGEKKHKALRVPQLCRTILNKRAEYSNETMWRGGV